MGGPAASSTLLCVARPKRLLVYMAVVRHCGEFAASRASGTGTHLLLRQKPHWPVRTYWTGPKTIPALPFTGNSQGRCGQSRSASRAITNLLVGRASTAVVSCNDACRYEFIACRVNFLTGQGNAATRRVFVSRCPHGVLPFVEIRCQWLPVSMAAIIVLITDMTARQGYKNDVC